MSGVAAYATRKAETFNVLMDFIKTYACGMTPFAVAMDSQLRSEGVKGFKAAVPAKFAESDIGAVWAEIMQCKNIDFGQFTVGLAVYQGLDADTEADKATRRLEWWATDGPKLIKMLTESVAARSGGRKYTKDELQGRILTQQECIKIVRSGVFEKMVDAIDKDDLATAHRQVSKPKKKVAAMLRRGLVGIRKAKH